MLHCVVYLQLLYYFILYVTPYMKKANLQCFLSTYGSKVRECYYKWDL